ncbi:MAG: flagellar biosynthetic protein FliQ [Clostridiales bacterium]|jgi:flagellar biosynthetic protein FliQ|nr:flagellar biosynthetic protein FliQ [Clostridiales bacterium]
MDTGVIIDIAREALMMIITLSAPILLIALVVGLVVSIFQTVTSIQEQTLAFVPKILAVFIGLIFIGSWMLIKLQDYMTNIFSNFITYIKG